MMMMVMVMTPAAAAGLADGHWLQIGKVGTKTIQGRRSGRPRPIFKNGQFWVEIQYDAGRYHVAY
jgi:hypothetical protein